MTGVCNSSKPIYTTVALDFGYIMFSLLTCQELFIDLIESLHKQVNSRKQ